MGHGACVISRVAAGANLDQKPDHMPHGRSPRTTHANRPILMTYDGDFLDVEELQLSGDPLHYVLVDLRGSKSTTGMYIHGISSRLANL